jgi:hypothetical protein
MLPLPDYPGRAEPIKAVCDRRATASGDLPGNVHAKTALTEPARQSRSWQLSGHGREWSGRLTLKRQVRGS